MLLRPAVVLCTAAALARCQTAAPGDRGDDPARAFFADGAIPRIAITLDDAARASLRKEPRQYAACTIRVDGRAEWKQAGVKLKGAAGSFRELDDRPGFTVRADKFGGDDRLHGLARFHLNNAVQDDTWLNEWLGADVFAAAGHPAPRVTHARVWLDGRDLGVYVLREAFDAQFLRRVFGTTAGNLYDGGFCQDVDSDLEKDAGTGADDHADLRRLREQCRGADPERPTRFARLVDVDAFVDFIALEAMLCHWDGYSQNRNNYRLWLSAPDGRAHFLPHGMDQLLGDPEASVLRHPPAIVASAVLQHPAWRQRYRERLRALLPLFAPHRLLPRVDAAAARVRKALHDFDPGAASAHAAAVRGLRERIEARYRELQVQVKAPEPRPLQFAGDKPIALKTWHPASESERVALARKAFGASATLQIACEPDATEAARGAWRASVLLARGHYRLCAAARCEGVSAPPKDADGHEHGGAALRVDDAHGELLTGTQSWRPLACDFEVAEFQRDVELELDLHARAGKVWFRTDSLQLVRLPD